MNVRFRGKPKLKRPAKPAAYTGPSIDEIIREARQKRSADGDYRERSLRIHGLVCAKCGREFDHTNRQLLTVHHKDGNHRNNPADGSNWENLCVYCHEDEHSRGVLADYLSEKKDR
ncbi:MAG: YajD family HNH nuclease [Desulfobacterales bacterium]|jgi:5-methylcytosine-specific restriction endonuclease McrA|nr:YajD family HNH nuclease [Desulfobacterales bacterium]